MVMSTVGWLELVLWLLALQCTTRAYKTGVCGNNTLGGNSGTFASPGYPANYLPSQYPTTDRWTKDYNTDKNRYSNGCYTECSWTITSTNGLPIRLVFDDLFITNLVDCKRNYINIHDGPDASNTRIMSACGTSGTEPLYSTRDTMYVRLISEFSSTPHRFRANWTTECFGYYTELQGRISSVGSPNAYPADLDCTYFIRLQRGYQVFLEIESLSLDPSVGGSCNDSLTIYDAGNMMTVLGGPYCGSAKRIQLELSSHLIQIKFRSDSNTRNSKMGFSLSYHGLLPECPPKAKLGNAGTITSPGFPHPYPEEGICQWTLDSGDSTYVISLKFLEIQLGSQVNSNFPGGDCDSGGIATEVAVYDGRQSDASNLLARFCERNLFSRTVKSSGRYLTIVFTTKNLRPYENWKGTTLGFNATYDSIIRDGGPKDKGGALLPFGPFEDDNRLDKNIVDVRSRTVVTKLHEEILIGDAPARYVYVHQDGQLSFSNSGNDDQILSTTSTCQQQPSCDKRSFASVCVYCACVNINNNSNADVYFQLKNKSSSGTTFTKVNRLINALPDVKDFDATIVFMTTWYRVQRGREDADNLRSPVDTNESTFQVAIAASALETYAIFLYKKGSMSWQSSSTEVPRIDVGTTTFYRGQQQCQQASPAGTKEALKIDKFEGNADWIGVWVYKIGERPSGGSNQICTAWHDRSAPQFDLYHKTGFASLPSCPCRLTTSGDSLGTTTWIQSHSKIVPTQIITCLGMSKAVALRHYPFGKECCYTGPKYWGYWDGSYYDLVTEKPYAGSALAYNSLDEDLYDYYIRDDKVGYEACCVASSSSSSCDKYYELRPMGSCINIAEVKAAGLCCDPYIETFDGEGFPFNCWGEFILYIMTTKDVTSTLQARTDLAETESGRLSNATVFSAFGVEEGRANVFVQLDPNTKNALIVYGNGEDFSRRFQSNPNFLVDTEDYTLQRRNNSLHVLLPTGISLEFLIRLKSLAISMTIPNTYRNQTLGLMGNFNGIKGDDFVLPNGTSAGTNLTERRIFEKYGPAWAVTANNSVMRYAPGEGVSTFSHPDFVPIFFDEQPADVQMKARAFCGDNMACLYDYVATNSTSVAQDSKVMEEALDTNNRLLENSMPQIKAPKKLHVTSGVVATFTLNASDPNGDAVTFHAEDTALGAVQVDAATGTVQYSPNVNTAVRLRFYAMDSKNLRSINETVEVYVCPSCSGRGTCDFSSVTESVSYYFHRVQCVCDHGWEGERCERDFDGCAANPCLEGQTCRDLTPQEQGDSVIGFDCGACPVGHGKIGSFCHDVDECQTNNGGCQMTCINEKGSFRCGCQSGYRLNQDGRTCSDVNECGEGTDDCDQLCRNIPGGFECLCENGYTFSNTSRKCDQDPNLAAQCRFSGCSQGCKRSVDAISGQELLQCFCFGGFINSTEDQSECVDKDECIYKVCSQECLNFDGGFSCACSSGFKLDSDRTTCVPCQGLTYGRNCQYQCRCSGHDTGCNHVSGCVCQEGWRGTYCEVDIDECAETPDVCSSDHVCVNTQGSYVCRCPDGFIRNAAGSCSDIDECAEDSLLNTCAPYKLCNNVHGSFFCTCPKGYIMSPSGGCVDIDECALGISECQQLCTNQSGSYNCECFQGYRLNADRVTCTQVVEVCRAAAECDHGCTVGEDGNAICFCDIGFILAADRQSCIRVATCANAGCSHTCTTVDDRPVCDCPAGMKLSNDLKNCTVCPLGTYGTNCGSMCSCGLGSSRCDVISGCVCKTGWSGDACDVDVNDCDVPAIRQKCQAQKATCFNEPGSYRCQCATGFSKDDDGVCKDINECNQLHSPCSQRCENTPGSYRCLCNPGFISQDGICNAIEYTWLGQNCSSDADCQANNSDCFKGSCLCTPGYYYSVGNGYCVRNCTGSNLQQAFVKYPQSLIGGYNDEMISNITRHDCFNLCLSSTACRTLDYQFTTGDCYLQSLTPLDVARNWIIRDMTYEFYQRQCS